MSEDPSSVSTIPEHEEEVVNVKHLGSRTSSVPHLPSLQNKRTTSASGGLRKLQVHLAKVQGENSNLEALVENES